MIQPLLVPQLVEHVRPGQVAPRRRHLDVRGRQPERAGIAVEHRPEHAERVETRQAQPLDVRVRRHQRAGFAVGQEAVLGNRRERARPRSRPAPNSVTSRRATASSSSTVTSPSTSDAGADGSSRPAKARATASALSSPVTRNTICREPFTTGNVRVMQDTKGAIRASRHRSRGDRVRPARRRPGTASRCARRGPAEQDQVEKVALPAASYSRSYSAVPQPDRAPPACGGPRRRTAAPAAPRWPSGS